ncbi:MAG TPA: hypothetical protein P5527_05770 [Kiritimatiellia bacterium]|nr:hypothetical protein [Kiritimatiellia bacterium]
MIRSRLVAFAVSAASVSGALTAPENEFSYEQLAERLFRLDLLAVPPVPGERSGCVSSFDRSSAYVAAPDTYTNWHANNDGSGCVRSEGDEIVAAELDARWNRRGADTCCKMKGIYENTRN